jgi:cellulose synthase operon protein C
MSRTLILALVAVATLAAGCDLFTSTEERVDRAAALLDKGDYATASIELRNALKKEPDNAKARVLMARAALWLGDVQGAAAELKKAVAAGAPAADTSRIDAEIKLSLHQFAELQAAMEKMPAGLSESERLMYLGYSQLGQGNAAAALQTFDAAVKSAPKGAEGSRMRNAQAEAMAATGDQPGAMKAIDSLLVADPGYQPASMAKASLLVQRGDLATAEKILAGMNLDKPSAQLNLSERMGGLGMLTEAQLGQGKTAEAAQSLALINKVAPNSLAALYLGGRVALAQGKSGDAVTLLQKAVQGAPDFVAARLLLAVAQLQQGNVAVAESELQAVLQAEPDNVAARKLLAQAQIRQGRASEAAAVLAPALASNTNDPAVYTLAGQASLMEGDRSEGEAYLERGLQAAPDDAKARLDLAASYLAAGDAKRALEIVATVPDKVGGETKNQIQFIALASGKDKAVARMEVGALVKRNPGDVKLLNLAAGWFVYQGDVDTARIYLEQARAAAPKDPRTLVNIGRLDYRAKNLPAARQSFEAAIAADPKQGDAYVALATMAEQGGDAAQAAKWIEAWSKADPSAPQPRLLLARAAFAKKDPAEGRKLVEEAIKAAPNNARVEGAAGQLLLEAGLYDEALNHFRKGAAEDPRDPAYDFGAARAQLALNQREAARDSLNQALAINPTWLPAVGLLAQLELGDKKPDAAMKLADRLKGSPATASAGYALEGDILMATGQAAKAAAAYAQSGKLRPTAEVALGEFRARKAASIAAADQPLIDWLKMHPDDSKVRFMLAQNYDADGDTTDAIREYEKVAAAQPGNAIVLNNLAWLYEKTGDPRAAETAKRAFEKAPKAAAIADTYGWILLRQGKVDEALKIIQQAHDSDQKNAEIEYHLGVALQKAGKHEEARKALENAIAAGGSAPWVAEARKALAETQ